MAIPTVKCPNCGQRIPIPAEFSGSQEKRITCGNCGVTLRLQRKQVASWKGSGSTAQMHLVRIPGYRLMGRLGKGGMGSVFSGVQTASGRLVAIKVLPPSSAANPDLLLRFEREAKMLASLTHPNVVQIVDRGQVGNVNYFVMEYIPGRTLKDRMENEQIPLREVVDIVTRVGEAIQHCHDHGLVHRDLKPGNILLTPGGEVKVTDFGISGLLRRMGDITEQGVLIGTPQYVAPEQLRDGSRVDHRADQYSLAVLAYETLTNTLPVGVFDPVSKRRAEVPARVDSVLSRGLARDPADRYRSVREFIHEFRRAFQMAITPSPTKTRGAQAAGEPDLEMPSPLPSSTGAETGWKNQKNAVSLGASLTETDTQPASAPLERALGLPASGKKGRKTALAHSPQQAAGSAVSHPGERPGRGTKARGRGLDESALPHAGQRMTEGAAAVKAGTGNGSPRAARSKPSPIQRWWCHLAAPHRFALVGVASLFLVGVVAFGLHGTVPDLSNSEGVVIDGGILAPSEVGSPILQQSDLELTLAQFPCCGFLFSPRTADGQWSVKSDLFRDSGVERLLGNLPLRFVDASLGTQMDRAWRWEQGTGLVFSADPPGERPRMLLAFVSPFGRADLKSALSLAEIARNSGFFQLPDLSVYGNPPLLTNGAFGHPIHAGNSSSGWKVLRVSGSRSSGPSQNASPPVTSTRDTEPFVTLDSNGPVHGISQSVRLAAGKAYAVQFTARGDGGRSGWISVGIGPADLVEAEADTDVPAAAHPRGPSSVAAASADSSWWALSVEAGTQWKRYEIRWRKDETRGDSPILALQARQGAVDLKKVELEVVEP